MSRAMGFVERHESTDASVLSLFFGVVSVGGVGVPMLGGGWMVRILFLMGLVPGSEAFLTLF